ncbi:leukocyte receptor cluster member 9 isoform 5-T5 [Spinachia spinachia]
MTALEMASEGPGRASVPSEDQRDEGTHPTHAPIPGKDTLNATAECDGNGIVVCQFFLMGKCRFGPKCRFSHSNPSVGDSPALSPDHDDKRDGENTEKHKKKVNKATEAKSEAKDGNKKPRMRTAEEVISRILWDPSVDGAELVVGYVDRFLGVLERPFNDFNWDTHPCDCDYSSELALPQHRIQYFLCRGRRVWDRHSRTDKVFGSTGQSLAPPFGGEGVVKEKNTDEQQQEQQPPAEECAHTESAHVEEEKQSEMNTQPPHSSRAAPECRGDTSHEQLESPGTSGTEEAAVSKRASKDRVYSSQKEEAILKEREEENPPEWKESWEGNEDALGQHPVHPLLLPAAAGGDHLHSALLRPSLAARPQPPRHHVPPQSARPRPGGRRRAGPPAVCLFGPQPPGVCDLPREAETLRGEGAVPEPPASASPAAAQRWPAGGLQGAGLAPQGLLQPALSSHAGQGEGL